MKFAYQVGLALLVNIAIVSGPILPGRAIGQPESQPVTPSPNGGTQQAEADELLNRGTQQLYGSQYKAAEQSYLQALKIYREINNREGEAWALLRLGEAYRLLSQYEKAIGYYEQARPIFQNVKDLNGEAWALNGLGIVHKLLSQSEKAIGYYEQALSIFQKLKDDKSEASILGNLGVAYRSLSQYDKAIASYQKVLIIFQKVGDLNSEAKVLNNLGNVYLALSQYDKAIGFYQQALLAYQQAKDLNGEAKALANLSTAYLALSQYNKAIDSYQKALLIYQQVGDRNSEALALAGLGNAQTSQSKYDKAIGYYQQALPIFQQIKDRNGEASALGQLGIAYLSLYQFDKAIGYYQQALPIFHQTKNRESEAASLFQLALAYRIQNIVSQDQRKLTDALKKINAAIEIIESIRGELKNDALKTSYFTSVQGYYQLKTEILMQLHQQQPTQGYDAQALETSDQSRGRVLRELLIQSNANINTNIDPQLLKQERTLNQTLDAKELKLIQLSSQSDKETQITQLKQEIAALYTDRDTLKNTIRATNPAYANLQYPKPTKLAELQQQLDRDTFMLQYSLGEKESYLWVISNKDLHTYILPKRSDIEKTAQSFRDAISINPSETKLDPITTQELFTTSQALTQQILTPAAALLGNKRLIIIPDGKLHQIPFAALTSPNSKTYQPLITQQEITNLPSASTIGILRSTVAKKPRGTKTIAILADPVFETNDDRLTGKTILPTLNLNLDIPNQTIKSRSKRGQWARIENTAIEAKGILSLVPQESDRTAAFGFDANYNWITAPSLSQYRYIHLATHGFFDEEKPALSSLLLSSFNAQGQTQKSYLRLPELFNLNLPSEMIVLSACETGLGKDVPGEGLMGMTRGFMYAGALRVAVSLWKVDDAATAQLMQQLYQSLWRSKKSHAASLREAQLKLWNEGTHPYYWSAFTLQGEWLN
jgi:CHAT domain-containing protein